MKVALAFHEDLLAVVRVLSVGDDLLGAGVVAWRAARRRGLSLVDAVSFEVMRREGIRCAFAFDRHFPEAGFRVLP